jgi:peptidoglycan/xylan/chitin deacetylase (PgdA/CDA1 family)
MRPDDAREPRVVLSLDFELRWGLHDVLGDDIDAYRENLEGVRDVVPRLLALFGARGVRATWATVGALACRDWDEYFTRAPAMPRYVNPKLAFDPRWADRDPSGALHFAPDLLERIATAPGQEIGSHTFSHIYFGEPGVMARDVERDAAATSAIFEERLGVRPISLVFPRNQLGFLAVLAQSGVEVVRSNPPKWYWQRNVLHQESRLQRAARFADALRPLSAGAVRTSSDDAAGVLETTGSAFIRLAGPALVYRAVRNAIEARAAKLADGDVLHLWLHPHNLGADPALTLDRLEGILDGVSRRAPRGTRFSTMGELRGALA